MVLNLGYLCSGRALTAGIISLLFVCDSELSGLRFMKQNEFLIIADRDIPQDTETNTKLEQFHKDTLSAGLISRIGI